MYMKSIMLRVYSRDSFVCQLVVLVLYFIRALACILRPFIVGTVHHLESTFKDVDYQYLSSLVVCSM